jgi:hypothetical protein
MNHSEIRPGSGPEGRILAEFRGLKKRWDYRNSGLPALYLWMARKWKMPVREIKRIVHSKVAPR